VYKASKVEYEATTQTNHLLFPSLIHQQTTSYKNKTRSHKIKKLIPLDTNTLPMFNHNCYLCINCLTVIDTTVIQCS